MEVSSNVSADAARCKDACQARDVCEYWLFKAQQADPSTDGCYLKLAPATPAAAADTYTSIKLATGDYTVWPVSGVLHVILFFDKNCKCFDKTTL